MIPPFLEIQLKFAIEASEDFHRRGFTNELLTFLHSFVHLPEIMETMPDRTLQQLMLSSQKWPKLARNLLKEIFLQGTATSACRLKFGRAIQEIYPAAYEQLLDDREPRCNVMMLTVQFLTTPSVKILCQFTCP